VPITTNKAVFGLTIRISMINFDEIPKRTNPIGPTIKKARMNTGLTQKETASELGCSLRTYIRYEKSETRPSFAHSNHLADLFGVDPMSLRAGELKDIEEYLPGSDPEFGPERDWRWFRKVLRGRSKIQPETIDIQQVVDEWRSLSTEKNDSALHVRIPSNAREELDANAERLGLPLSDTIRLANLFLFQIFHT